MEFNIFKKKSSVFNTSVDNNASIREQALEFFDNILGLDGAKENLYRTLISENQTSVAYVGPPATAKTLLTDTIVKKCRNVIKFDATNSTSAGLFEVLKNNTSANILVIDEIDKLKKNDQAALYSLLNDGTVTKILKTEIIRINIKGLKVIATCNTLGKLAGPLKSRLEIYKIKEYTDEEFIEVAQFCLRDRMPAMTAAYIATELLNHGKKDIRGVLNIANKVQKQDTLDDIKRIIMNWIEYQSEEEIDYN